MQKSTLHGGRARRARRGAKALALVLALVVPAGTASAAGLSPQDGGDPFGREVGSRWRLILNGGFTTPVEVDPAPGGPIDFENGYLLSAGLGYHVGDFSERLGFAVELEGLYAEADTESDSLAAFGSSSSESASSAAAMLNGIFDWRWSETIALSFGAGAGYAVNDFDTLEDLDSRFKLDGGQDGAFAAQGKLGLVYDLGGRFAWTVGYRYFRTESLEATDDDLGASFDLTNELHVLEVGVRFGL